MTNTQKNPKVDHFIDKLKKWQTEFNTLRTIMSAFNLKEEFKWGKPCYTYDGKNVVLIHEFKEYCALLFIKGALLKDPAGILIQQTENVQAARQIRFKNVSEINALEETIKAYIEEAIIIEKSGMEVPHKKTEDFVVPEEFEYKFNENQALKASFEALTPGRQRAYLFYFAQAKRSQTRISRIEKYIPKILEGKGLDD